MPARYFPMAQEFNSDAEGWQLTDQFGDRALRIWIEILSILDREKNSWKLVKGWDSVISRKVRQSSATVRRVVDWMLANGWLEVGQLSASGQPEVLQARNYHKFRKISAVATPPPNPPNPPLLTKPLKNAPSVDSTKVEKGPEKPKELNPKIKMWADQIYRLDPQKFARLIQWIKAAERTYHPEVIAAALERFLPYAADVNANWWGYLDKILDKEEGKFNAVKATVDSDRHKEELGELADALFGRTLVGVPKRKSPS